MNERFITHFENNEATRSQSVLLELMTILGFYRKDLYLVGGWAPYFLLKLFQRPEDDFQHAGSIDIDLVIDSTRIPQDEYATIVERISARGYAKRKNRTGAGIPFSFERDLEGLKIVVDFLSGEYGGTSKQHRHQRIDGDLLARKARGADILQEHHIDFQLKGTLPDGAENSCPLKMANVVSILTMKGITISERYKEKDAYDIYSVLAHYKEGPKSCLEEIKPHLGNKLIHEGIKSICDKFPTADATGPFWAATFIAPGDPARIKVLQAEIFNSVRPFMEGVGKLL
jgi:hypothetical protein